MTGSGTEETVNQMAHLATEGAVGHDIYLPIAAVFVAALSFGATVLIHRRERRAHEAQQAIERWNDVLSICAEKPIYLDANFSTEYSKASSAERFTYDAFNYKAWSLVDYIIDRGLYREIQFRSMVYWICAHSRNWLDENPFLFGSNMFWHVILNVSKEPLTLFKSRTLPLTSGYSIKNNTDRYADQVDWDEVSEHYDDFIIGPFADEMVRP